MQYIFPSIQTFFSFFSSIFCSFQHIRPDCALLDLYLSISICLSNCNWYCIFNCGFQVFIDSRDITDFYMFILYSEALMNLLSSSMRIFLQSSWDFFIQTIMSLAYRDNFLSCLLIYIPFISFSYLIGLAITSSTTWNNSSESRHPRFVLNLKEKMSSIFL